MNAAEGNAFLMGYLAAVRPEMVRLTDALSGYGDALTGDAREVFKRVSWSLREGERMLGYLDTITDPDTSERSREVAAHLLASDLGVKP